jgi:hypothetical protein
MSPNGPPVTPASHPAVMTPAQILEAQPETARPTRSDVLEIIRGDGTHRAVVDPGLAGGLRAWLEDGLSSAGVDRPSPLIITKQSIRSRVADQDRPAVTFATALGALVDALFRQLVTLGRIDDPMQDGLSALAVDPRKSEVISFVSTLGELERAQLQDELETQAAIMVSRWPRLSPAWMPRTQERVTIPLVGGRVVLVGIIDLVIGSPSSGRASIGLVEVKSGRQRAEDRADLRFYSLLETLRSGAPPFRITTFYTRTGQAIAEDVDDQILTSSVERILAAAERQMEAN